MMNYQNAQLHSTFYRQDSEPGDVISQKKINDQIKSLKRWSKKYISDTTIKELANIFKSVYENSRKEAETIYIENILKLETDPKFKEIKDFFAENKKEKLKDFLEHNWLEELKNCILSHLAVAGELSEYEETEASIKYDYLCNLDPKLAQSLYEKFESSFKCCPLLNQVYNKNIQNIEVFRSWAYHNSTYKETSEMLGAKKVLQKLPDNINKNKVIKLLFWGETGAGKSAWINVMTNYWLGIKYEEKQRIKLILESNVRYKKQEVTTEINSYDLQPNENIFGNPIRFIDTPGLNSPEGFLHDYKNLQTIRNYISENLTELHGVVFVIKATVNRWTSSQKAISELILGLFAKNFIDNIFFVFTFAEPLEPEVIIALNQSKITFNNYFKSNISGILSNQIMDIKIEKAYFNMVYQEMNKFFTLLNTTQPQSLAITKELFKKRDQIEDKIKNSWSKSKSEVEKNQIKKMLSEYDNLTLRPDNIEIWEYIDLYIQTEKSDNKGGCADRIVETNKIKEYYTTLNQIRNEK